MIQDNCDEKKTSPSSESVHVVIIPSKVKAEQHNYVQGYK